MRWRLTLGNHFGSGTLEPARLLVAARAWSVDGGLVVRNKNQHTLALPSDQVDRLRLERNDLPTLLVDGHTGRDVHAGAAYRDCDFQTVGDARGMQQQVVEALTVDVVFLLVNEVLILHEQAVVVAQALFHESRLVIVGHAS